MILFLKTCPLLPQTPFLRNKTTYAIAFRTNHDKIHSFPILKTLLSAYPIVVITRMKQTQLYRINSNPKPKWQTQFIVPYGPAGQFCCMYAFSVW